MTTATVEVLGTDSSYQVVIFEIVPRGDYRFNVIVADDLTEIEANSIAKRIEDALCP